MDMTWLAAVPCCGRRRRDFPSRGPPPWQEAKASQEMASKPSSADPKYVMAARCVSLGELDQNRSRACRTHRGGLKGPGPYRGPQWQKESSSAAVHATAPSI